MNKKLMKAIFEKNNEDLVNEVNRLNMQLRQENDRLEKRVSMLEETVRRKQYEVEQVRDRLDRREKELIVSKKYIETLKVEIMRLNTELLCKFEKIFESEVKE